MITSTGPTAVYVRISDDPKELGLGVKRQEDDCRALAKRLGWPVREVYADNDLSAMKSKRPAYNRLLRDIELGLVTRLIIDKPDRLYRRNVELEHLIDVVGERVEIRTVKSGAVDLSTVNGRMVARILGATAQAEVETLRERVSRKAKELQAAGKWTGGPRPFGWEPDGEGYLQPVAAEVKLIKDAAKRILNGDTIHSVARDWRDHGVRGTRLSGKERERAVMADSAVKTILTHDRMASVVSPADLAELRAILSTNGLKSGRRMSEKYLVTGAVLRCGICGGPMYGARTFAGKDKPHYECKKSVRYNGCGRVAIEMAFADEQIMEAVVEHLTGYLYPPKVHGVRPHRARFQQSPRLKDAVQAVVAVQRELDDLPALVKAGEMTARMAGKIEAELLPRLKAAQTQLEAARANEVGLSELAQLDTQGFVNNWRGMRPADRRKVVLAVVKEIRVMPHSVRTADGKPNYNVKDYSRVKVEFKPDLA